MAITENLKKIDRTLLELLTGIVIYSVLCQLVGLFLPFSRTRFSVGLWLGIMVAVFSAIHMWRSLQKAFLCDEKSAARLLAGGYVVRYLITGAFLVLLFYTGVGYVLTGFLGVIGLKAGAYLQPVTHKFYNRMFHETDPVAEPLSEEEWDLKGVEE